VNSSAVLCCFVALWLAACSKAAECPPGAERCPCYQQVLCDEGLECLSGMCVEPLPEGGDGKRERPSAPRPVEALNVTQDAGNSHGTDADSTPTPPEGTRPDAGMPIAEPRPSSVPQEDAGGNGTALVKFCNLIKINGANVTIRASLGDVSFVSQDEACSECRAVPAGVPIDVELTLLPEEIVIGSSWVTLLPGSGALLGTVESGAPLVEVLTAPDDVACEEFDAVDAFSQPLSDGPSNVKFCNEAVGPDGEPVTLRLSADGQNFDATTGGCSSCVGLRSQSSLLFELLLMPESRLLTSFESSLDPGTNVVFASRDGDLIVYPLGGQSCEDSDPF
jgi:hypothetical protein